MNELEQKNLLQTEAQVSDELSIEDLEAIAGGGFWDDVGAGLNAVKEGVRDIGQGFADGLNGRNDDESNLNYLGGYAVGGILNTAGSLLGGKGK